MRKSRYQKGSVKKQRGRWIAMWWEGSNRKSRAIGLVKDMTKSEARTVVGQIVAELEAKRRQDRTWPFGEFVTEIYFPYYIRKWKGSTRITNVNRVSIHLVEAFGARELTSFKRDELQALLDEKAHAGLSFSTVDHLRWDIKQIFDMALSEGHVEHNPALLLYTPRDAGRAARSVMNIQEVQMCFAALDQRERLVVKLAVLGRDATRRDLRSHLGTPQRDLCRYSAKDLSRRDRYAKNNAFYSPCRTARRSSPGDRGLESSVDCCG